MRVSSNCVKRARRFLKIPLDVKFTPNDTVGRSVQNAHILIVDDEQEVRALLRAALAPEGFRISAAKDGHGLMAALQVEIPDLITLDLNLSGKDGLKLVLRRAEKDQIMAVWARSSTANATKT